MQVLGWILFFCFVKVSGGKIELFFADAKNKKEGQPLFKRGALLFMIQNIRIRPCRHRLP